MNSISIGVTTAPRLNKTIDETIESLGKSGWSNIHIFAEPDSHIPNSPYIGQISRRKSVYGAWKNWFDGLQELRSSGTDYVFMCQDDIIIGPNTRELVKNIKWPKDAGLISLFCPDMYKGRQEWNRIDDVGGLRMAQTYIFPKHVVDLLLNSKEVWRFIGSAQIDNRIGLFLRSIGLYPYYHTPSLAQHIGHTSTIWPDVKAEGMRAASDFNSESYS